MFWSYYEFCANLNCFIKTSLSFPATIAAVARRWRRRRQWRGDDRYGSRDAATIETAGEGGGGDGGGGAATMKASMWNGEY